MEREKIANSAQNGNFEKVPTRTSLQQIGNKVIAAADLPSQLTMEYFSDLYKPSKIQNDRDYVERMKLKFDEDPELTRFAKRFERAFIWGVQTGRWLGNVFAKDADSFETQTFSTTEYDDYSQKVDAFTTLRLDEPFEADNGKILKELPLAFDVTVTTNPQKIHEKLTMSYNGHRDLPFGFSYVDYYTNGQTKSKLEMCPRYVIGVTSRESRDIDIDDIRKNPLSPTNLEMRFKVLSEIRAQNELFEAMLPDDAYESEDPVLKKACAYIEAADGILNQALGFCTKALIKQKALPPAIIEEAEQDKYRQRSIIENYFLKQDAIRLRVAYGNELDQGKNVVDTYNEIIGYARRMANIATDSTQIGTKNHALVARERAVKEHRTAVELEEEDAKPEHNRNIA